MSRIDRILAAALWCLGAICVAGIVHILSILNFPAFEGKKPIERIGALAKAGDMTILPHAAPGGGWAPFSDPALVQGACLYDLSAGPARISGLVDPARMLTLSFRAPSGEIFYSMTDRAAQHGRIDVLVLTEDQLESLEEDTEADEQSAQELRLVSPDRTGFVLVNALAAFPSERTDAEARVRAISCASEAPD